MSNVDKHKRNKYKKKYLEAKKIIEVLTLYGGEFASDKESQKNLINLRSVKNKDYVVVIGAGNKDLVDGEDLDATEDYSRFHSSFNIAITNSRPSIDFTKTDLVGLCADINSGNDMLRITRGLAGRASKIVFDYSVVKFLDDKNQFIFNSLLDFLKPGGTLIFDQTLTIFSYSPTQALTVPFELGIYADKDRTVAGKKYINKFVVSHGESEDVKNLPTNAEIIANNKKFLENIRVSIGGEEYTYKVTLVNGEYPVPKYSKKTSINKELANVDYFIAEKVKATKKTEKAEDVKVKAEST
jgi:hypothetical protein